MTPADAAELLTIAAAFDRRKIGDTDAIAWADALRGLDPHDCADAIRAHFRDSTEYLMPAHVRTGVKRIRAERIRAVPSSELEPADVDPADIEAYQVARLKLIRLVADGRPLPAVGVLPHRPSRELAKATLGRLPRMPRVPGDAS